MNAHYAQLLIAVFLALIVFMLIIFVSFEIGRFIQVGKIRRMVEELEQRSDIIRKSLKTIKKEIPNPESNNQ